MQSQTSTAHTASICQRGMQPTMCIYSSSEMEKMNAKSGYSNNIHNQIQSKSSDTNHFSNESQILSAQPHILTQMHHAARSNQESLQQSMQHQAHQMSKVPLSYSLSNQIQIPGAIYSAQNTLHAPMQSTMQVPLNMYASQFNLQGKLPNVSNYGGSSMLNSAANPLQLPTQSIYSTTHLNTNPTKSNMQPQMFQNLPIIQAQQQASHSSHQFIIPNTPFDGSNANNSLMAHESSDKLKKAPRKRTPKKSKPQHKDVAEVKQEGSLEASLLANNQPVDASTIANKKVGSRTYADGSLHVCLECSKAFTHPKHLEAHKRQHQIKKMYSCNNCPRAFTIKGNLERHVRSHMGTKPFPCSQCSKEFSQSSHLKIHLRRHTGERPFICSICFKAFSSKGNLERHTRTHTGERPFVCSRCFMVFSQSSHLDSHMRTHSGLKPFKCEQCLQSFASRGNLDRHMKTHLGPKTYKCGKCSTVFEKYGQLHKHQQTGSCPGAVAVSLAANLASVISLPLSALSAGNSQSSDLINNAPIFSISIPITKTKTQPTYSQANNPDNKSRSSDLSSIIGSTASTSDLQQSIASSSNSNQLFAIPALPMSQNVMDPSKRNQQIVGSSENSTTLKESQKSDNRDLTDIDGSEDISGLSDSEKDEEVAMDVTSHCASHTLPHINVTLSMNNSSADSQSNYLQSEASGMNAAS